MKIHLLESFQHNLGNLPPEIRKKFYKQLSFLAEDIRYPSLHAKKREELGDVWQARVDDSYRFYFQIRGDTYFIVDILKHPK